MLLKEAEDRGRGLEVPDDEKKNGRGLSPTDAEAETKGQDRFTSSCPVAKNQTWVCVRISWRLTHFLTYSLTHPISLLQLQKGIRDLKSCLFCCCCCCLEKKPHIDSFFICFLNKSRFRNFRFYKLKLTELSTKNAKQSKSEK